MQFFLAASSTDRPWSVMPAFRHCAAVDPILMCRRRTVFAGAVSCPDDVNGGGGGGGDQLFRQMQWKL